LRYTYAYKTSDGVRHEAAMEAPSRDAVFKALRGRGIKAIKVVAADGSKANGELRGVRKRMVTAIALAVALATGTVAYFAGESGNQTIRQSDDSLVAPRHQLYGDPVIIEAFERGRFDECLPNAGDRLLAWFAQPGKLMCPKETPKAVLHRLDDGRVAELQSVVGAHVEIGESDPREVRELKQIVNGMREELREYLANGNGTVRSYWRRLVERTRQEAQICERTRRELEKETKPAVWEAKNEALRNLGLRPIPNPRESE